MYQNCRLFLKFYNFWEWCLVKIATNFKTITRWILLESIYQIVLFIYFFFPSSPLNFEVYFVLCICSSGRASSLIYMQVMDSELDQVAEWLKENAPGANNVRTITIR